MAAAAGAAAAGAAAAAAPAGAAPALPLALAAALAAAAAALALFHFWSPMMKGTRSMPSSVWNSKSASRLFSEPSCCGEGMGRRTKRVSKRTPKLWEATDACMLSQTASSR